MESKIVTETQSNHITKADYSFTFYSFGHVLKEISVLTCWLVLETHFAHTIIMLLLDGLMHNRHDHLGSFNTQHQNRKT